MENDKIKNEAFPSDEFLGKIKGKQVKVFYWDNENINKKDEEPEWFEGKLVGFDEFCIALESGTDFKRIGRECIETLYARGERVITEEEFKRRRK